MVQLKWTKLAVEDLKEIHDYVSRDSTKYARIQIIRIKSRTKILKSLPFAGRIVPEYNDENYRELIEGNYRIIYKIVTKYLIDILTVHHAARDLSKRDLI